MTGPGPSTVISELPVALPVVSETVVAFSEPLDLGAAAATSAVGAPLLPSSQDDLDVPLSTLLSASKECTVDPTHHGGEDVRPPPEKEVLAENVGELGVASTLSPRFTRFLPAFADTFSKLEPSRVAIQGEHFVLYFYSVFISLGFSFCGLVCCIDCCFVHDGSYPFCWHELGILCLCL